MKKLFKAYITILLIFFSSAGICEEVSQKLLLAEQLIRCTARIEAKTAVGVNIGTGFFFSFFKSPDKYIPTIVTCKHVVKGAMSGMLFFTILQKDKPLSENRDYIPINIKDFESSWISHPDPKVDLCIMPIAFILKELREKKKEILIMNINASFFPSEFDLKDIGPLENIVFIGYPIGIWDSINNFPIARQGVLATDVKVDYENRKEFMIDAACFPGSSGSPVFLFNNGVFLKQSKLMKGNRLRFLGVLYGGPQYTAEGTIVIKNIPTKLEPRIQSLIPTNLGLVIKAELLMDFEALLNKGLQE